MVGGDAGTIVTFEVKHVINPTGYLASRLLSTSFTLDFVIILEQVK